MENSELKLHEKELISFEITLTEKIHLSRYCKKYNLDKAVIFSIMLARLIKEEEEKEKERALKASLEKSLNSFKSIRKT